MSKPSFLSPGSVVKVVSGARDESGSTGFVRRTKPTNGDPVLVTILDGKYKGTSLSFQTDSLAPVE